MGGTEEAAGGLWGADKAGLSPSSPCPQGLLAPKILASHDANRCSLGRARGSRQLAGRLRSFPPCPAGLPELGKATERTWGYSAR